MTHFVGPAPEVRAVIYSASQISTWIECERKWGWRYIVKDYPPPAPSAELGSDGHAQLEGYLRDGTDIDYTRASGEIVRAGLHLLPAPRTPGMHIEKDFSFQSPRTSLVYGGRIDVAIDPGVPLPMLGFDGSAPVVLDHKTTSSIDRYAKSTDDLLWDVQATIYAYDAMSTHRARAADLAWVYYQTRGAKRATARTVRMTAETASRNFAGIEREAQAMDALRAKRRSLPQVSDEDFVQSLRASPSACNAYGGCPYRHRCNLSPKERIQAAMGSSIIDSLRNRVQNAPVSAPVPAPAVDTLPEDATPAPPLPAWATAEVDPLLALNARTPAAMPREPAVINPPEKSLPPAPIDEPKGLQAEGGLAEAPKKEPAKRGRPKKEAAPAPIEEPANTSPQETIAMMKEAVAIAAQTDVVPAPEGFTLYVDCVPIGRKAKTLATFIEKANAAIQAETGESDYRFIAYNGAAHLVAKVLAQVDGTTDLVLDTRTPEGAVLLSPLMAKAAFVVRGLR